MNFNLKTEQGKELAKSRFEYILKNEKEIEIKEIKKKRSSTQNRALHLYFTFIANELNNQGQTFNYTLLTDKVFEIPFTAEIIKNQVWRMIQIKLFNIESTTKINTNQINEILEVTNHYFSQFGILVEFPNIQTLLHKLDYGTI